MFPGSNTAPNGFPSSTRIRPGAASAAPRSWTFIPEADHNDIQAQPGYWPAIREFLGSLAPAP